MAAPTQTWVQRLKGMSNNLTTAKPAASQKPPTKMSPIAGVCGRTAWSCIASISTAHYPAKYWYDGAYTAQAKQDAAEVALRTLTGTLNTNVDPPPASYYVALQQQHQQRAAAASSSSSSSTM
ncbi:hypothetical protein DE146DRAFT_760538 [Phaeosphaeria sp. MPI-PUGE-AT-0046c]|nr:hypothetical protein DE146DRAFT_760538 [Phaeosphaeria sp. MPI-PUGE-AT-0046c]